MSDEFPIRQRAIRMRLAKNVVELICAKLERSRSWFYTWWPRFLDSGVDGLRDQSRAPHNSPGQLSGEIRAAIVAIRDRLVRRRGVQARYRLAGAPTIRHELAGLGYKELPSLREIERVLQQSGRTNPPFCLQPPASTTRYPAPPAQRSNQLHQLDLIGPRYLKGSRARYYFLTYKDVFDHALYVEFHRAPTLETLLDFAVRTWQKLGLPQRLQVDNDSLFGNAGRWPGSLNRFIRLALLVGIELVFIPEGEPYRNGAVEHFNGWLQERLLSIRLRYPAMVRRELAVLMQVCGQEHIHPDLDYRTTAQVRRGLPVRRLPANFKHHRQPMPVATGKVHFIRRVRPSGRVTILKVKVLVGKRWRGRYVWITLHTRTAQLKIYHGSVLIKTVDYALRGAD